MTTAVLVRQLERARAELRVLTGAGAAAADPVALFTAAFGEPDQWQTEALLSSSPRLALNVTRQGGKSSVAAAIATHTALSEAGALVLVVSPSLRQSGELFRKVLDCYGAAGRPVPPESETKLTLDLANGARVVSLPGKEGTVRGYSGVRLLLIDEASRALEALYYSVRPMLAVSAGRIVTLSTPFGRTGWWADAWHSDEPWERYEVPAERCPRIPRSFLEEERRSMPEWFYLQEYGCQFMESVDAVFRTDDIEAALSYEIAPLFQGGAA